MGGGRALEVVEVTQSFLHKIIEMISNVLVTI